MFHFAEKHVKICNIERCGFMSYYFSSDGSLKYSTKTKSSIMSYVKSSASDIASTSNSSSSSSSSFTKEMKSAALAAAGKMTSSAKDAARASNQDYQRIAALQARIQKIASHKPRTFDDDEQIFTFNTTVLNNYTTAQEKYNSYKKSSTSSSS